MAAMTDEEQLVQRYAIEFLNAQAERDEAEGGYDNYILRVNKLSQHKTLEFVVCHFILHTDDEGGPINVDIYYDDVGNTEMGVWMFDGHCDPFMGRDNFGILRYYLFPAYTLLPNPTAGP